MSSCQFSDYWQGMNEWKLNYTRQNVNPFRVPISSATVFTKRMKYIKPHKENNQLPRNDNDWILPNIEMTENKWLESNDDQHMTCKFLHPLGLIPVMKQDQKVSQMLDMSKMFPRVQLAPLDRQWMRIWVYNCG